MDKTIIQKSGKYFSIGERHAIIQELLETNCTKQELWQKYTGEVEEHGQLLKWMRRLGYDISNVIRRPNIVSNTSTMSKQKLSEQEFEKLQLQKRISELEKQLKDAELKAIAFSTMVDIAEDLFKIPIRKKLNTKP
jgi:predicted nuclease with TOPRIM domain